MRFVFISAVEFGYKCLETFIGKKVNIVGIFTLDEKKAKNISGFISFDKLAEKYNIPIFKIKDVNSLDVIEKIKKLKPDYISVIGWSQMISKELLSIPKKGCINIHPTLLPKNRGRAPIPWTLIKNLKKSGVTLYYLDEDTDSGDVIAQKEFTIDLNDDAKSVYKKALSASTKLLKDIIPHLINGTAPRKAQNQMDATYWPKRSPDDGIIDWDKTTMEIYNWIRGLTHPYPGAFTFLNDKKMFVWKASLCEKQYLGSPGEIVDIIEDGIIVKTSDGCILLNKVQLNGEEETTANKIIEKHNIRKGIILNKKKYGINKKETIRKEIRSIRSMQSKFEKIYKNKNIRYKLFSMEEFKKAKTISIYISRKNEVDTKEIIKKAFEMNKMICVPSMKNKPCMCLITEKYNIHEHTPLLVDKNTKKVKPEDLDIIIVPGIAFDEKGRRIGSGKGYYDTFLSELKGKKPIIALAFDFQIVDEIPSEPHDVHMDKIVTEKRIINC